MPTVWTPKFTALIAASVMITISILVGFVMLLRLIIGHSDQAYFEQKAARMAQCDDANGIIMRDYYGRPICVEKCMGSMHKPH